MQATVVPVKETNRVPTCATLAKETSSDVFRLVLHFSKRSPFLIFPLWVIYMWNQGRQEYSPLITLHPQFSKLVFACFCFWLFKEFLTFSLLSRSVVYACDLRTEGCASRLVFYQTMKHGVFMHPSLLAAACFHVGSYSTTSYPDIITLRFNPSPPLFLPTVSSRDVTYAAPTLCTYSTGISENRRQCLSWFFRERGKAKGALKLSHRHKTRRGKKVNMDYCAAWAQIGSR